MAADRSVSVVIPTYGKREVLGPTLESLARQDYAHDLVEVVVVDDCSRDDTFEFLRLLETPYALRPIRHEENRGRAAARNTAIRAADGDLVVFVDDDMRCDPRLIREHVDFHASHPGSVVIGNALTAPELGRATVYSYLDEMGVHRLEPGSRVPSRYFVTNNSSVAREHLLNAGLFDETFRNYGFEDTELAFRLEDADGVAFWYCAEAVAYHIHVQTLDQVLAKRLDTAAPLKILLDRHPHRARELSADLLTPVSDTDPAALRLRKLVIAAATNRLFYGAVKAIAGALWLGSLSRDVMAYLIACQYRKGLAEVYRGS